MSGGKDNALLFDSADAGPCAAVRCAGALTHFYKHQRAVFVTHDEVNLTAATAGCSIIGFQQAQARDGNAGLGGGYEKSARYSIGLEADVRQRYYFSLRYNDSYDRPQPVNALGFFSSGSGTYMQNNRGWVSLTFKTSF